MERTKSRLTDWWIADCWIATVGRAAGSYDERPVFDSVSLPHEVLPTVDRERWAASGWMHEDQQRVETHPDYMHSLP